MGRTREPALINALLAVAGLTSAAILFRHLVHRIARLWERR
jgi:hypothetical protein